MGIDLGITHFVALSNGEFIESPRHYRKAEKKLKKLQEALSRKKRGSHRRQRTVKAIGRAHRKVRNQRRDFAHKASRKLVNHYQVIILEHLHTKNLIRRPKPKQDKETGQYLPMNADVNWIGILLPQRSFWIWDENSLGQEVPYRQTRVGSLSKPLPSRDGVLHSISDRL